MPVFILLKTKLRTIPDLLAFAFYFESFLMGAVLTLTNNNSLVFYKFEGEW